MDDDEVIDVAGGESAPWQIKSILVRRRHEAIRFAKMAGQTVGEWVSDAIDRHAEFQEGSRVEPQSKPEQSKPDRKPSGVALGEVAACLHAMATAKAAGLPISDTAVRGVVSLIREDVRVARGLPDRQPKARIGQTISGGLESRQPDMLADESEDPTDQH